MFDTGAITYVHEQERRNVAQEMQRMLTHASHAQPMEHEATVLLAEFGRELHFST